MTTQNINAPYSEEAEQSVIGSVLLSPNSFLTVRAYLEPTNFFLLRHQYIWKAMDELHEENIAIDHITLADRLEKDGVLNEVGGRAYIIQLVNTTGSAVYADVYGRIVQRAALRRKMMETADTIRDLAQNEDMTVDSIIAEMEAAVFDVSNQNDGQDIVHFSNGLSEYYDNLERLMQNKDMLAGLPTGFRDLDQITGGFKKKQLLILAGRPGMGKSAMAMSKAMNIARMGGRVAFFTMEMGVQEVIGRAVANESGINVQKLSQGELDSHEASRLTEAMGRIADFQIFIDETSALTPVQLRTKCRRLQHEYGLDLIIIDYVQLMSGGDKFTSNRVQEVSYLSRHLKETARELNVPVLALAQLNRAVEQRQDKRPVLSDLRESGQLEQDADIVMFLYRDEVYNEATEFPNQADIIVAKHRNGPTGTISLYFEKTLAKFKNASVHRIDLSDLDGDVSQHGTPIRKRRGDWS